MSSYYRQQLEDWLGELDVKADTVFDIGGGQGVVKSRVKSWDVKDYRVLDLPDYDLDQWEQEDSIGHFFYIREKADLIFVLEVFEYLINPIMALDKVRYLLKDGGRAYITIPLVYPVHNEIELDSLRYTENGFKRLCASVDLKAEVVKYRRDKSGLLQSFYLADKMHPAKGVQHDVTGYIFEVTE